MSESESRPKLVQLENFLLKPESDESKNYIADLLSGGTSRPEDLFVQKFLSVDFWKEMGFSDNEIKVEYPAGAGGRVEITLYVEGQKIAVECKRPYIIKNNEIIKHNLNGNDITELKDQISQYLLSHSFIIFTNGFHWFFYSRESYRAWVIGSKRKDVVLKPYFEYLTADTILNKSTHNYILNTLKRENILSTLSGIEYESIRHILADDFFVDLKSWINVIDFALKKSQVNLKARTTALINKLIFVRTMEDVGIIPNGFLSSIWNNKKGVRNSSVDLVDHIDDELSEIYDTELFTSKYIVNDDGQAILKDGIPEFSEERRKNFAYSSLPEDFFTAILRPIEPSNLKDTGMSEIIIDGKKHSVRSLYWWRFESIPADILGKAYETYLARERKKLGIYYTPHQITEHLTKQTINTVFDEKISELRSELLNDVWNVEKIKIIVDKIKNIRICDPSCGSGSFLIQAVRVVWSKYKELEIIIKELDKKFSQGHSVLDNYFTEKVGMIRYLELLFRINNKRERIGILILRHIFGNDKDIKASDTAKLNIWLECLRLDPNSYRRDELKGKRHVLPNLELNITNGDSLVGFNVEQTEQELLPFKESLKPIFRLRDLYTESFEKTSIAQDAVRIRDALEGFVDDAFRKTHGDEIMTNMKPTHWALQHFDVFYDKDGSLKPISERGFDVIIGNPPWEILKPNINEFFSPLYNSEELERFSLLTKDQKNKIQNELLKNQTVVNNFNKYQKIIQLHQNYFNNSKEFSYQSGETDGESTAGDINLYKLFVERYFQLLKKDGLCGVVLPSGFYTDLGSKGLRKLIFSNTEIDTLISFENRNGIFEEIHRQFKFIIIIFRKSRQTRFFKTAFYVNDVNFLNNLEDKVMMYDLDLVTLTSPNALSLIECKNKKEVNIIKKLFVFPLLATKSVWNIQFTNEFHMTKHAPLFNTEQKGSILYEGKIIHQFTHVFSSPRYWIDRTKAMKDLLTRETKKISALIKKQTKSKTIDHMPPIKLDCEYYRLAWRDITNATNTRTLIATILHPGAFLGNTLNYLKPVYFNGNSYVYSIPIRETLFLCGLFNSFVIDFILRQRVATHANMFYVSELPIPRYSDTDRFFSEVTDRVGSLICTTKEYDRLKIDAKIKNSVTDEPTRQLLIAQINAYVAKIYELTQEELEYILDSFPIVEKSIKESVLFEFNNIS